MSRIFLAAAFLCIFSLPTVAAPTEAIFPVPSLDRWHYLYNFDPGSKPDASVFGAVVNEEPHDFDDRDAQFLMGYDTTTQIPSAQGQANYRIISATLTARVSRDLLFIYDPTFDTLSTYQNFGSDTDPGRPIELYSVGYRGTAPGGDPYTALNYLENSPWGDPVTIINGNSIAVDRRYAYAAQYDNTGQLIDASNNVRDNFEAEPIAIGITDTATAGDFVPVDTDFTFEVNLSDANTVRYFQQALDQGMLHLMITSLKSAFEGIPIVPAFYCKESIYSSTRPVALDLTVCIGPPSDYNCSGATDFFDLLGFLDAWFAGSADFNLDNATDFFDLLDFLDAWFATS